MRPIRKTNCRFFLLPALLFSLLLPAQWAGAQSVGISSISITPDASSILELRTTSKGLLIPRMTTAERDAISTPATGLMIFNTSTGKFNYYNGSAWISFFAGTAGVNSITGTTNRISIGGTADDPTIDIASNYAGQNTISTLGTISTGTWNGSIIQSGYGGTGNGFTRFTGPAGTEKTFTLPNASAAILTDNTAVTAAQGGTGQSSYTIGDLLYASSASALSKLNAVAAGSFLRSAGTSTAPVWSTTTWPNSATTGDLLYASDNNTYANLAGVATGNALISGGAGTAPSWGKIGMTTHVTGILPVANGGTNSSASLNNNRIMVSSSGAITEAAALTNGQLLIGSTGAAPVAATLTAGNGIVITNAAGSVTIANEPTITQATGTSTLTTTSLTDVSLSTELSVTPGAGDYMVYFTGMVSNSNAGRGVIMSLYDNGTKIAVTEMQATSGAAGDRQTIMIAYYLTGLGAGEKIEVRWRAEANTATITNRILTVHRVK